MAHYVNCPPEDEVRRLPAAFFESVAVLTTPSTAQGSRRSTVPDRTLQETRGKWGAATCPAECLPHLLLHAGSVDGCPLIMPESAYAAELAAALRRNSYLVLPNVLPVVDAQRLAASIVDNVVQVTRCCLAYTCAYSSLGNVMPLSPVPTGGVQARRAPTQHLLN